MRNYYYILWVDAIVRFQKHHPKRTGWKVALYIYLSWMNALNLWIVMIWLKYFKIFVIPQFEIDIFPGKLIDSFLSFTIEFALVFFIINYFLIFHNNRYEKLLNKYSDKKWNLALPYSISMAIGAFVTAILYGILT